VFSSAAYPFSPPLPQHFTDFSAVDRGSFRLGDCSKIPLIIAIIFLFVADLLFLCFRRRLRDESTHIFVTFNLSVALMAWFVVYLTGIGETSSATTCRFVAGLLLLFITASFAWMMILAYVRLVQEHREKFLLRCFAVGWLLPLALVILAMGIDYGTNTDDFGQVGGCVGGEEERGVGVVFACPSFCPPVRSTTLTLLPSSELMPGLLDHRRVLLGLCRRHQRPLRRSHHHLLRCCHTGVCTGVQL
jgi:hypothetical protein